jgi:hypothetical protein
MEAMRCQKRVSSAVSDCYSCGGTGNIAGMACRECNGTGTWRRCDGCDGNGKRGRGTCHSCGGVGYKPRPLYEPGLRITFSVFQKPYTWDVTPPAVSVPVGGRTAEVLERAESALELTKSARLEARDTADWVLGQFVSGTLLLSPADMLALTVGTAARAVGPPAVRTAGIAIATKVAGVSYVNADGSSRQELISGCKAGDRLSFEREPRNTHDANAIKVLRVDGSQIGYLPADVAAEVASKMDRGVAYDVRIESIAGWDSGTMSVNLLGRPTPKLSSTASSEQDILAGMIGCIQCGKPAVHNREHCTECAAHLTQSAAAQQKRVKGTGCLPTTALVIAALLLYIFQQAAVGGNCSP